MKIIEDVTIPLIAMPPPMSHRLVRWLVRDGVHVTLGEVIFELEVDHEMIEVESFLIGHLKQLVPEDTVCQIGDCIGKVLCDEIPKGFHPVPLYLSATELSEIDSRRGEVPREAFVRDTFLSAIKSMP